MNEDLKFALILLMLGLLNINLIIACGWLKRVCGRLNRLPRPISHTENGGAVTYYVRDDPYGG